MKIFLNTSLIYDNKHIFFSLIISQFFLNEPTQDSANFIE